VISRNILALRKTPWLVCFVRQPVVRDLQVLRPPEVPLPVALLVPEVLPPAVPDLKVQDKAQELLLVLREAAFSVLR
jgi:hypothetical protein